MPRRDKAISDARSLPETERSAAIRIDSGRKSSESQRFTFTDVEWQAIRSTRKQWPEGVDWRREIEQTAQDYFEVAGARETWLKRLQGKSPAKQRKEIIKTLKLTRESDARLTNALEVGLVDRDFVYPDYETAVNRLENWLYYYELWVGSFAGTNNPIRAALELKLLGVWQRSGGRPGWSRKNYEDTRPYAPLIDYLTLTHTAILGITLTSSGVAAMIDRHRGKRQTFDPFLTYAMSITRHTDND